MSLARARELRLGTTIIERRLWNILRTFREQGYHFRRQVPIGPYYADFACHHAQFVIEADGATHIDADYDARRDRYMRGRGFKVLRFSNGDIVSNPDGVFQLVAEGLKGTVPLAPTPTPSPSPRGGGVPRKRSLRGGLRELAARTGNEVPSPPSPLLGGAGAGGHGLRPRGQS
jgi:very-short-patch-repair endonuclease